MTTTTEPSAASRARVSRTDLVRAFISSLERHRWFAVPVESRLPALLREPLRRQGPDTRDGQGQDARGRTGLAAENADL